MNWNNQAIAIIPIANHQIILPIDSSSIQNNSTTTEYKIDNNKQDQNGFDIYSIFFFIVSALLILLAIMIQFLPDDGIIGRNTLVNFTLFGGIFYGLLGLLFHELGNAKRNKKKSK
jgi:hypothetical protein